MKKILLGMLCLGYLSSQAQNFNVVGSVTNHYPWIGKFILIPESGGTCGTARAGAAWNTTTVDFTKDFIIEYDLKVRPFNPSLPTVLPGNSPSGADGWVVAFGNNINSGSLNAAAAHLGYYDAAGAPNPDFVNSIGVAYDVHRNDHLNDLWGNPPNYGGDHVIVTREADHFNVIPSITTGYDPNTINPSAFYITVNQFNHYKIEWDCDQNKLYVYYNGSLRQEVPITPSMEFTNPASVAWGITAARAGDCSEFEFKNIVLQYDDQCNGCLDAKIDIYFGGCHDGTYPDPWPYYSLGMGGLVTTLPNSGITGVTQFVWDFGDGSPQVIENNPLLSPVMLVHDYYTFGPHTITLTIHGMGENNQPCTFVVKAEVRIPDCSLADGDDDTDGGGEGKPGKPNDIGHLNENKGLKIFPNPATGIVSVDMNIEISKINVSDITGKTVITHDAKGSSKATLDMQHLSNGIYNINVSAPDGSIYRTKLVLQKQ